MLRFILIFGLYSIYRRCGRGCRRRRCRRRHRRRFSRHRLR
jgi:hypothetical protein